MEDQQIEDSNAGKTGSSMLILGWSLMILQVIWEKIHNALAHAGAVSLLAWMIVGLYLLLIK